MATNKQRRMGTEQTACVWVKAQVLATWAQNWEAMVDVYEERMGWAGLKASDTYMPKELNVWGEADGDD